MEQVSRIRFTPKQKAELWERWKSGQCIADIARSLERRNKSGVYRVLALTGGIGPAPLAGIPYQGALVGGLAFTVNFRFIRRYTPSVIMNFNFVAPVVGVLLGAALLGERVTKALVGGLVLVATGLVLIARK